MKRSLDFYLHRGYSLNFFTQLHGETSIFHLGFTLSAYEEVNTHYAKKQTNKPKSSCMPYTLHS